MPLTFGPETPEDDERQIARGYQQWVGLVVGAIPIAMTAYGLELKWVVGLSLAILLGLTHESGGRLHDLCIRVRRAISTSVT